MRKSTWKLGFAGAAAGCINGLFGAGGGMILVPMLSQGAGLQEEEIFPASVSIMLPLSIISLAVEASTAPLPWTAALPYLIGSASGGVLAGLLRKKIPVSWLHRVLGLLILYGAWRYLC